jgi:hypothetical protein
VFNPCPPHYRAAFASSDLLYPHSIGRHSPEVDRLTCTGRRGGFPVQEKYGLTLFRTSYPAGWAPPHSPAALRPRRGREQVLFPLKVAVQRILLPRAVLAGGYQHLSPRPFYEPYGDSLLLARPLTPDPPTLCWIARGPSRDRFVWAEALWVSVSLELHTRPLPASHVQVGD